MLIYLAAPIESGLLAGEAFRAEIKATAYSNPNLTFFDPHLAYTFNDIGGRFTPGDLVLANRAVLLASDLVVASLAGCETWREIECAVANGKKVYAVWPPGVNRSPCAEQGLLVFDNIGQLVEELINECKI